MIFRRTKFFTSENYIDSKKFVDKHFFTIMNSSSTGLSWNVKVGELEVRKYD